MHAVHRAVILRLSAFAVIALALPGCGTPPTASDIDAQEVVSFHDEGLLGNALTRSEVKTVLKLVDDICGDTWCEGDSNFRFRHLYCESNAGTCALMFQMAVRDDAPLPRWHWQTCRTSGFLGFDSLVNTTSGGYQWLTDDYYEALSACIDRLESGGATPYR
jgi:hypothetical protein